MTFIGFYSSRWFLTDEVLGVVLRSTFVRRLIWNLIPASVLVGALWIAMAGENGLLERSSLQQRLISTEARVADIETGNRELQGHIRSLKTAPDVRRRAAAEMLLRAEEGSTIYRFDLP
mgnify:CR=1 FL=1